MKLKHLKLHLLLVSGLLLAPLADAAPLVYEGTDGPGKGKHIVFLAGDHEYRSEETLPALARILAKHHGFKCTVLFNVDPKTGEIVPGNSNMPGLEALKTADLAVVFLRFQDFPDEQMKHFVEYLDRGGPVVGLRTATHAFKIPKGKTYSKYSWDYKGGDYLTGWGHQVLGQSWVGHYGRNHQQSTRIDIVEGKEKHPILRGVKDIWVHAGGYVGKPTDGEILTKAQPLNGMEPDSPADKSKPPMPSEWTRTYEAGNGKKARVFTTLYGASEDLVNDGYRRMLVNACFWAIGVEDAIKADSKVDFIGPYKPNPHRGGKNYAAGIKPSDYAGYESPIPAHNKVPAAQPRGNQKRNTAKRNQKGKGKGQAAAAQSKLPPGVLQPMNPESVAFKSKPAPKKLEVKDGDSIVIIGSGMASRMNHFPHFETETFLRFPDKKITIRNMGDEGNTPGFRPHPGRNQEQQYAFPGAKELLTPELQAPSKPQGHFETPDQWLTRLGADTIIAFFGYNSSFGGPGDVDRYKKELEAFIKHTLSQKYNGESVPQLALVSPTAAQDLSKKFSVPDGSEMNKNLKLYADATKEVAEANGALFVDAFTPTQDLGADFTVDGALLNEAGYEKLAPVLADGLFGEAKVDENKRSAVHSAVEEKNFTWLNDFKMPNGVHVFGRRYNPYGPGNYPYEIKKTRQMTANRDQAIWATLKGENFDLAAADAKTIELPPVETNYKPSNKNGTVDYLPGEVAETKIDTPEGYEINLFASEKTFPDLKNPVQIAFDNKGRLWVATMESYPHYKIGDPLPKDKLLILEDTDKDGVADKQTVFADDLHIPMGFEISHDGVYVSQSGNLVRLQDTNGDDKYDKYELLLSGFDDHDTHHAIAAFCADPSGAFIMCEGVFLHSNTESIYGPERGTNGGFFRYSPQRKHIMRYSQYSIPNPWGVAFDDYGQDFFLHTSGTSMSWMLPGALKARYGANLRAPDLITSNKVRPTSGIEFVSSRHFPNEAQGDVLINNNIGYLGAKQHKLIEDGTGFTTEYVQDLYVSKDLNFRPVDLEFAPDGSLYVCDWQNALIGHMQHSARDPMRDHNHGRIYRVTYPSRPLVEPAKIDGASIAELLENLKLHEYRSRYRTKRELRERDAAEVAAAASAWAAKQSDERHKLEALWVTWGADKLDTDLVKELLKSDDHRIRAAAVRVARFNDHKLPSLARILSRAANDKHGRVRLEAVNAATYLPKDQGVAVLAIAEAKEVDDKMKQSFEFAKNVFSGKVAEGEVTEKVTAPKHLTGPAAKHYVHGAEIYAREAHCGTCHQTDGKGLPDAGFPPIAGTKWTQGDPDRLIKLTLNGLMGPIEVQGKEYPGQVPMTPFGALLNDEDIASVLTYVRNSFGNKASPIEPGQVKQVRDEVKASGKLDMFSPEELLKQHPMK
ncbi:MAG: c-type cytochrome [Verrucomicrobiales bacterium]|nr:c-type cytochrome [Verrucomicrobiales bacterium]